MDTLSLSTSAFNDAARCLKKYEYRWVEGLVPLPRDVRPVMRRGIWIHRCLQLADRNEDWLTELNVMSDWALRHDVEQEQVETLQRETHDLVTDYLAYWLGRDDPLGPWEMVGSEEHIRWQATPKLALTSSVDVLKRDKHGRVWIWERKTTQEIPDSDWRTVDPQTMLQYIECRKTGVEVAGIIFDYIGTRPGASLRVKNDGHLYAGDESKSTRARHFKATEAEMRAKGADEDYIEFIRQRVVSDGDWFQRYPTMRPDENAEVTLKDVAGVVRGILESDHRGHYPRSINLLDCRLFCPYGKLCMREYQLGRKSPALREEYTVVQTDDLYGAGRGDW